MDFDNPDWNELLKLLNSHRVKYLIVGGYAVALHGRPRYTKDLDVWVEASPINADALLRVLRDFGFDSVAPSTRELQSPDRVFVIGHIPHRVDILTTISGIAFAEAYPNRVAQEFSFGAVPFIGRADLIQNKKASGRLQDLPTSKRWKKLVHRARCGAYRGLATGVSHFEPSGMR